jgi:HPt (histidine-containing phosphotransfer) domain-containing protein
MADTLALEQLAALPGIDVARGMAVLRGKAAKYLELLRRFVEAHVDDMQRLTEYLAAGDQPTALRLAHSLKGAAATLGFDHLAEAAKRIEASLRASAEISHQMASLQVDMQTVSQQFMAIAAKLPHSATPEPSEATDTPPPDAETLRTILDDLDSRLAQGDFTANQLFKDHAATLHAAFGAQAEMLAGQVRQFDFKSARETLCSLRAG